MAVSKETFALMFLSVQKKDPGETISFLVRIGKFSTECLGGSLEVCYVFV